MTLGELTASIAHEVNQPLAGAVGNGSACLRWLERNPPRLDEVRASVEAMISDCNRAAAIIARIRALAKKSEPQKRKSSTSTICCRSGVFWIQRELQNHDVGLEGKFEPELLPVFGDRVQVQQVIINLILNAVESIQAAHSLRREIVIRSGSAGDGKIAVEIEDSGAGIDPANADKLFDAFFSTKQKGLGMGLSISRSIVEAHEGSLMASNAGDGAVFRFTLPPSRVAGRSKQDDSSEATA